MKMFLVVYADYFDERITRELKQAGYKSYMKLHDATGENESSEARLGTFRAPGRNKSLFMAVPDEEIPRLIDIVRRLKEENPAGGFRAVTWMLEECNL